MTYDCAILISTLLIFFTEYFYSIKCTFKIHSHLIIRWIILGSVHEMLMEICWFIRYLALVTALSSEADYVFIPEAPPSVEWRDKLCDKLEQASGTINTRLALLSCLNSSVF